MSDASHFGPVFKLGQPDDNYKFRPLPAPLGAYPYHLKHGTENEQKMVFHMVGDTGGFRDTGFQHLVAAEMTEQYHIGADNADQPQFLYHLGDLVYNHGEAGSYSEQFFRPYENYPGHIYAIAGNHDSDINPDAATPYASLEPFMAVFCDKESRKVSFGGATQRKSITQPNVYWTLVTPLANIIGLHSNVPKYGIVTPEQRNWLIQELQTANLERPGKALIIAIHHAPYSADTNHGSSLPMIELLEGVFEETGIRPDLVISGHVHNYQRFAKQYPDGKSLAYIVAGAGGYDELHSLAAPDNPSFTNQSPLFNGVKLQAYHDAHHGFLKFSIEKNKDGFKLTGEYYLVGELAKGAARLTDKFTIEIG